MEAVPVRLYYLRERVQKIRGPDLYLVKHEETQTASSLVHPEGRKWMRKERKSSLETLPKSILTVDTEEEKGYG